MGSKLTIRLTVNGSALDTLDTQLQEDAKYAAYLNCCTHTLIELEGPLVQLYTAHDRQLSLTLYSSPYLQLSRSRALHSPWPVSYS